MARKRHMIVRCTRKLLHELSIRDESLDSGETAPGLFADWHANLVRIDRRKCLLLADSRTLFTFLVPAVLRRDLLDFGGLLRTHCSRTLSSHGIDPGQVPALSSSCPVRFAKTNNRSVLGSMNDYAFQFKVHITAERGLKHTNMSRLNHKMNETPMGALNYERPIRAVENELGRLAI